MNGTQRKDKRMYRKHAHKVSKVSMVFRSEDAAEQVLAAFRNHGAVEVQTYSVESVRIVTTETQVFNRTYASGDESILSALPYVR